MSYPPPQSSYPPPQGPGPYNLQSPPQNYGQQQPYPPAPPQNGTGWYQPNQDYNKGGFGEKGGKFNPEKPRFNDIFFAILFLAQFAAYIAVSVICLRSVNINSGQVGAGLGQTGGNSITLDLHTAYLLCFIVLAAFFLSMGMLATVRAFTKIILEITLVLSVLLSIGYAIYLYIEKFWSGAVIATIFAVISILAYFPMRRRIPFSVAMLQLVFRIAKEYPSTYVWALVGTFIQAAYSIWWSFTITAMYQKYHANTPGCNTSGGSCGNGAVIVLAIFLVFSFYWTSQFITNLFLTTEAGIFGTWYFTGGKNSPGGAPKNVAFGAFRRAATYSFGSIAFGSLIVALLDLLRAIVHYFASMARQQGDMVGYIFGCIADCLIGCITWAVEYFNRYAYIEIALYGKAYVPAAKDTWRLFKDRGIDALINDCLINNIWTFASYIVGLLCSFFAYIYLHQSRPEYIVANSGLYAVVLLYAFLIAFFISHSLGYSALSSGVSTIFVGLAEDPQVLAQRDPALFELIRSTYPHVVMSV